MTPLQAYQQALLDQTITADGEQKAVVLILEALYQALENTEKKVFLQRFKTLLGLKKSAPKGLYLWGEVGRGKTFLMDLFYHSLTVKKLRLHFFEFMQQTQQKLIAYQGQKNPLQKIAADIAEQYTIICFDEFFVKNITDAMILGELFKALFDAGLVLVTTSNVAPDDLYKNGIQREQFLAAIEAIKSHTQVVHLNNQQDYRRRHLDPAEVYYTPLGEQSHAHLLHSFSQFSQYQTIDQTPIILFGRTIPIVQQAAGVIWFEFSVLCNPPRSEQDYLAIAKQYHTVFIENIQMAEHQVSQIKLFISLIDILYDAHVIVILSANTSPENLAPNDGPLAFEFQRTISRLIEMQSQQYLLFHEDIIQ